MADVVKQILAKPIQLADHVSHLADGAQTCRQECSELKSKTERLAALLRQAARAPDLYERPARRIMEDTQQVLEKALSLVSKCRPSGLMNRLFTLINPAAFKKMSTHLDNSLADVSWLLRASSGDDDDGLLGLPPIAQNEPILFLIWQHIATLHWGNSLEIRADSAANLASLVRDNARNGKLIIEEDGVGPLLRLVREGQVEGQVSAARALGLLGQEPDSVESMLQTGVCLTFAKILKEGPMRAQAMVAWATAQIAASSGEAKCQDLFAQNNIIRLLIAHLAFETVEEHSKYSVNGVYPIGDPRQQNSNRMHTVIQSTMAIRSQYHSPNIAPPVQQPSQTFKGKESESPATKAHMKAMAALALCNLAKGNPAICKSITEPKPLLCFAALLEKGPGKELRHNCAVALMEIARVAEHYPDLRKSAFKPASPAARAVIDQLLLVVQKADPDLDLDREDDILLPCVTALGCLSRMFQVKETRVIEPLVRLIDEREGSVALEATVALTKFACTENYLHADHARAIIEAGGVAPLVQLVYLGKQVQMEALILLCYIVLHVPDSEKLVQAGVLAVLSWASKQGHLVQDPRVDSLLPEAKGRLELYQTRGYTGFL